MPSETEDELGDAGAVTPSLFLGNTLPALAHMVLNRDSAISAAVDHINDGGTVLTPSPSMALTVLLILGVPLEEAQDKVTRANSVLDHPFDIDF